MQVKLRKQTSPFEQGHREVPRTVNVTITAMTVIKVIAVLVCAYFVWMIRDVLGILFVAIVLASALDP
jgi:predicted PurR-regulated permease PerM